MIFGINFALCVAAAGGSNLESFQTFKNHAKSQKEIIKNHANIDEVKRKERSHEYGFFSQRKR